MTKLQKLRKKIESLQEQENELRRALFETYKVALQEVFGTKFIIDTIEGSGYGLTVKPPYAANTIYWYLHSNATGNPILEPREEAKRELNNMLLECQSKETKYMKYAEEARDMLAILTTRIEENK